VTSTESAIAFSCGDDQLVGILHRAHGASRHIGLLIVVGGPQYRVGSHRQFVFMARRMAAAGFPVFRFDYRGMGDSAGSRRAFSDIDGDIRAAMDAFTAEMPGLRGIALYGLCDAASAVLMYSPADPRVAGKILANPWVRSEAGEARAFVRHYYRSRVFKRDFWRKLLSGNVQMRASAQDLIAQWRRSRRPRSSEQVTVDKPFVERMQEGLQRFARPVLIVISERDLTAKEFTDLVAQSPDWRALVGRRDVRLVEVRGADHTFSSEASHLVAIGHALNWLGELERLST
jgi:exosortase A-associated hydrolase 1